MMTAYAQAITLEYWVTRYLNRGFVSLISLGFCYGINNLALHLNPLKSAMSFIFFMAKSF